MVTGVCIGYLMHTSNLGSKCILLHTRLATQTPTVRLTNLPACKEGGSMTQLRNAWNVYSTRGPWHHVGETMNRVVHTSQPPSHMRQMRRLTQVKCTKPNCSMLHSPGPTQLVITCSTEKAGWGWERGQHHHVFMRGE